MGRIRSLARNLFRTRRVNRELDAELNACLEMLIEEKIAAGLSPAAARRAAKVEFGPVPAVKDEVRNATAGAFIRQVAEDVRYAARSFMRQPGFLIVAVVTIALGIGLNASIFSVFNSLLLRPLPAPDSSSLVSLYEQVQNVKGDQSFMGGSYRISYPEYLAYRDNNRVFAGLAAYHPEARVLLENGSDVEGQVTSCNYFAVINAAMALGRGFSEAECSGQNSPAVVVLSNTAWREQFGSDENIIGRTIRMNRAPVTVIGVAAPGVSGTDVVQASFWLPLPMMKLVTGATPLDFTGEKVNWLEVVGRRRDGVSLAEARSNLSVIAGNLDKQHPGQSTRITAEVASLIGAPNRKQAVMGAGAVFLIAVGMVLMIACANLANLMLARTVARGKEIAMRLALGASRTRVVRQLLTEALAISAIGGTLGVLLACWSGPMLFRVFLAHMPDGVPPLQIAVTPDMRVVGYAFLLTFLAGITFGLAPALQVSRQDLNAVLKREGAGVDPGRQHGVRRGFLVGGQVAVCMVLLLAAGLMMRALLRAQTVDPGFAMHGVAVLSYDLQRVGYSNAQAAEFNTALADRMRALPNVSGTALASGSPLGGRHFVSTFSASTHTQPAAFSYLQVSPGFFSVVQIPLMRGRDFSAAEIANGANEVIVSESLARSFWPGQDPLGKILLNGKANPGMQVIGVARDAEVGELGTADRSFVYMPPSKADQWMIQTALVQYQGDYTTAANAMQAAAKSLDPALKVSVTRLEDNLGPYRAICRMTAIASGALGLVALTLAMIGLYGTVAYGVSRRTREIGLRVALGAEPGHVLSLLIRQAMRPVVIGAGIGVILCLATSRVLSGLLFGVSPHDGVTFAGVPLLLVATAVVASWLPARRALRVHPVEALREN